MERIYLSDRDKIDVCENNLVTVTFGDGTVISRLEPRRLFPVSRPGEYITLLDDDGVERAVIRHLTDVTKDARKIIGQSLDDYYLIPRITRIVSVSEKYGTLRWTVETDRGPRAFDIRNRNHDIRVYPDGRVRVRDSDDNRYVIDDYRALDHGSRVALIADL